MEAQQEEFEVLSSSVASVNDLTASVAHVEVVDEEEDETEEYGSPEPSMELSVELPSPKVVRADQDDASDEEFDDTKTEEEIAPDLIAPALSIGSNSPGVWEDVERTTEEVAVDPALRSFLRESGLEHLTSSALGSVSMSELESVDLDSEFEQLCDALSIVERIKLRAVLETRQKERAQRVKMEDSIRLSFENDRRRFVLSKTEVSELASSVEEWRNRQRCKIMLLGDCSVGKTALITKLCHSVFVSDTVTTVGIDFQSIQTRVDSTLVECEIWDTGGQERFKSMPKSYSRRMDALLFVYDVCDLDSFDNISHWLREMGEASDLSSKVIYLVGSKKDKAKHRVVPADRALEYADEIGATHYECSSKTGQGVIPLFVSAVTDSIAMKAARSPDGIVSPPSRRASLSRARAIGAGQIGGSQSSSSSSSNTSGCCAN